MSAGTRRFIEERRELRTSGLDNDINVECFQSLNRNIQSATRRDKNQYLSNICKVIQEHAVTKDSKEFFRKIRIITRKFKPKHWVIKDQQGNLVTELDKIITVWKDYCDNLYADPNYRANHMDNYEKEPDILFGEVEAAVNKLKEGKAVGMTSRRKS